MQNGKNYCRKLCPKVLIVYEYLSIALYHFNEFESPSGYSYYLSKLWIYLCLFSNRIILIILLNHQTIKYNFNLNFTLSLCS